jgi:Rieske Fe-S protein
VLALGAGATLAVPALAGCGEDDPGSTAEPASSPGAANGELVKLAEVPVGGAVSAKDKDGKPVIVAQPTEGTAVAFSAICTHKGCTVAPQDDIIKCPCHGSTYDPTTGDNTGGPAPEPLAEVAVSVKKGMVVQA